MLLSEGRQKCTIREAERMIQRTSQGKEKKKIWIKMRKGRERKLIQLLLKRSD